MATTSNTITATAGQTEFSFSFPYLKKESIKVTIDTVATIAFTIPDNNPTTVVLNSGATAGQVIKISRLTSTTATPATFFSGGAIRSQDLNDNFESILYITQEKENELTEVIAGGIADGSITSSKLADQSVGTAALIDGGVATVDLADNAVTTDKILDDTITPAKLDRTYVERAGNTIMTGNLTVPSLNGGQLAGFRNVLINGGVTINQRNKAYASVANGEYWADRWKKISGGMTQIVEDGSYRPSAQYTLSGTGVTTQQITSPASGNWTIPVVPSTATMIQLEEGPVATPFEFRPIGTELALCQRYFYDLHKSIPCSAYASGANVHSYSNQLFPSEMRAAPTVSNTVFVNDQNNGGNRTITSDIGGFTVDNTSTATGIFRTTLSSAWFDAELS